MTKARKFAELRNATTGETLMQMFVPGVSGDALSVALRLLTHQLQLRSPETHHGGGMFGGSFGYGVDFENDVFEMHYDRQDYDCTCGASEPKHAPECDQVTKRDAYISDRLNYACIKKTDAERDTKVAEAIARGVPQRMAFLSACGSEIRFERFEEYERLHPFPECSCGTLATWVESDNHARDCRKSIAERPNFTHKPSGLAVNWYKYIGRDNEIVVAADVSLQTVLDDCLRSIGAPPLQDALEAYANAEHDASEADKRAHEWWIGDGE